MATNRPITDEHIEERKYYLGKSDTVPESIGGEYAGMTVEEAKKLHAKKVAEADAELVDRAGDDVEIVDTATGSPETGGVQEPATPDVVPDEDALNKLGKDALMKQAEAEGVILDSTETKADLIAKIIVARA